VGKTEYPEKTTDLLQVTDRPAKVWYPCMAWTNFIDRPKTSRPWLYLTKHHQSGSHASILYLQQCKVKSRNPDMHISGLWEQMMKSG
jgi:hypothetical protein